MKPTDYIKKAKTTEPKKYKFKATGEVTPRIEHAVFGLVTEVGELMDALKRSKFYSVPIDKINMIEEVGDLMWYLALLCDELDVSFEEVWDKNIRKLKKRFPERYSDKKARVRNRKRERKELEK